MIYLDTHVVVWLYAARPDLLTEDARRAIEKEETLISPIVLMEIDYLEEIGRTATRGLEVYEDLHATLGLRVCERGFPQVMRSASQQTWTRDPFDRIVVGHAALAGKPLVTGDETIRAHYAKAIW